MTASHGTPIVRVALYLLLGLIACDDPQPAQLFLWEEGFEEVCDGDVPCGWERIEGDASSARWVTSSFLSGERSLLLSEGATIRGPGADPGFPVFSIGTLEARFIGRCDTGGAIDILVGLSEIGTDGGSTGNVDMTMPATVFLPETWTETPASVLVTSEGAFTDGGLGFTPGGFGSPLMGNALAVTSVTLSMTGPGTCEIAEIIIDDPGSTRRTLGDGC